MSNYKRATFEEEDGTDVPADGAISPDSVEVSVGQGSVWMCSFQNIYPKPHTSNESNNLSPTVTLRGITLAQFPQIVEEQK